MRMRFALLLFAFGVVMAGCNSGYIMGPEEEAATDPAPVAATE